MSNIDDILLGISESLKQLQKASQEKPIEQTQPVQIQNLEVNSTKKFTDDYYSKIADDYIEFTYKTQPSITLSIFQKST